MIFPPIGFMLMEDVKKIYADCFEEFIVLMQKFEVVFPLDEHRLLIPSLLPEKEEDSCLVFARSLSLSMNNASNIDDLPRQLHAPIYETPHPILSRFYLLPFIPNGFFSRLMARLMSSEIIDHLHQSLIAGNVQMSHVINSSHWKCWRKGVIITWQHMEIFRIAPLAPCLPGASKVSMVLKKDTIEDIPELNGVEIKVAILPEQYIEKCSILDSQLFASSSSGVDKHSGGKCLATWLLHRATETIDSVFEDWYESFAKKKGFDPHQESVRIANPCNKCMETVRSAQLLKAREPRRPDSALSTGDEDTCYFFTSNYSAKLVASMESLVCPMHGTLRIEEVAPDLVSATHVLLTEDCQLVWHFCKMLLQ